MGFLDLTAADVAEYIDESRAFAGTWFFHHIPKTAGSSLAAELAKNAGPYLNVGLDYGDSSVSFGKRREQAVQAFVERTRTDPPRSASGHVLRQHVDDIATASPTTRFFTFVRHPVKRVVSEYHYCCSERHPPHEAFKARYPTIEAYIEDPEEKNKAARYLFGDLSQPWPDMRALLCNRYSMIGLQERYPASFLLLSSMVFGLATPEKAERVASTAPTLPPGVIRAIAKANEIDLAIYAEVSKVYDRIASTLWALKRQQGPKP